MNGFSKNVMDILQLYEFSMAIGKSFDYRENCDSLLKLIMARKDLQSCWIYSYVDNQCKLSYSIPAFNQVKLLNCNKLFLQELHSRNQAISIPVDQKINDIAPFELSGGCIALYNLKEQGLLFLYSSKKTEFSTVEVNQLSPIIEKFTLSLQASDVFRKREQLLLNLEEQNQELRDYAHVVSHDLKSPIRNIETLVSWLKTDYSTLLDEKGIETFGLVSSNLEKMDQLIDGILRYSTIDKDETENYEIDLNKLVKKIIETLPKQEHLHIEVMNLLPCVEGDKHRMHQLFQNLIDNAIKYNNKTEIHIQIGASKTQNGHQFFIRDNGMGIEPAYYDKIFQIFQSLHENQESTGIGLSVVKKIVSFYGGEIWVESIPDEGTTFHFTLND